MDDAVTAPQAGRERVLMISPYPPVRDGIASYALQTVRALRRGGMVARPPLRVRRSSDDFGEAQQAAPRLRARSKGETVVQETTSTPGDGGGSANPTRSKTKKGFGPRTPSERCPREASG